VCVFVNMRWNTSYTHRTPGLAHVGSFLLRLEHGCATAVQAMLTQVETPKLPV
jgi:hypothetical protein